MMTLQRIFDKIVNHLRKQGERCVVNSNDGDGLGDFCMYRAEKKVNGRTKIQFCAAGCLIPKRDYNPDFENTSVDVNDSNPNFVTQYFEKKFKGNKKKLQLVKEMQGIHDITSRFSDKENQFKKVAASFGLKYTPPEVVKA